MQEKKFDIKLLTIHWLDDTPEEVDLCAHGQVKVSIGNEIIVNQREKNNHWTLTAMAIHLLRTIEVNHIPEDLVGEHLIPCCGHHIDHLKDSTEVHIQGCFIGINYWVKHMDQHIQLTTTSNTVVLIPRNEYIQEVLQFVDKVEGFYLNSKPKQMPDDSYDRIGYEMMWKEWKRRRNAWIGMDRSEL